MPNVSGICPSTLSKKILICTETQLIDLQHSFFYLKESGSGGFRQIIPQAKNERGRLAENT